MRLFLKAALLSTVLIVALILLVRQGPHDERLHLWALMPEQVQTVVITHAGQESYLRRDGSSWQLEQSGETWPGDPERVMAWLRPLLHPHAKSILGVSEQERPLDYERYGLGVGAATITVTTTDGAVHALRIGKQTALQDNYYVQVTGRPVLYLFSVYELNGLFRGPDVSLRVASPAAEEAHPDAEAVRP